VHSLAKSGGKPRAIQIAFASSRSLTVLSPTAAHAILWIEFETLPLISLSKLAQNARSRHSAAA